MDTSLALQTDGSSRGEGLSVRPLTGGLYTRQQSNLGAGSQLSGDPEKSVSDREKRLGSFEYHLTMLMFGFSRWVETCMSAADVVGLGSLDILILHSLHQHPRGQRLSEIGLVMNIDDTHIIAYSLKKLMNAKFVEAKRVGRERIFLTTAAGDSACDNFHQFRDRFLITEVTKRAYELENFDRVSETLANLASIYERAGRDALVATANRPRVPPVRTKR